MPTTRTGSQSDEEGSTHLIECTGKGPDKGKGCQSWVPTWLPKKIHKGFMDRPFLCVFCAAAEVADLQSKLAKITEKPQISGELSSLFNADSNQQYGRRDNVRIFGVEEAPNEDVYQAVIDVAEKAGCQVSRADISICHKVPSRNVKPGQGRPIIAKFVRRQTKIGLMTNKKKLKDSENKIYINDDLTLLRARLAKALRQRQDVTSVNMINEKIVVYQQNDTKTVFDSLFKLYEWDPDFVYSVCKSSLHLC